MHSRLTQGVRPHVEGKRRTPLSFRVVMGTSWSPLCGLKGVKPPVKFGERTWDCSPGHAGKDGPHLAMTEGSCGFSRAAAPVWGFTRGTTGSSGSLSCGARDQVSMCVARGSTLLLSSHGRGICPQDALKKDSGGLSSVVAGNPCFPRLLPVASRSFSECL